VFTSVGSKRIRSHRLSLVSSVLRDGCLSKYFRLNYRAAIKTSLGTRGLLLSTTECIWSVHILGTTLEFPRKPVPRAPHWDLSPFVAGIVCQMWNMRNERWKPEFSRFWASTSTK